MKTYPESRLTDLLIEFDEMGFCPTTVCPNPEQTAIEWKEQVVKEIQKLQAENAELRARLDKAVEVENKINNGELVGAIWFKSWLNGIVCCGRVVGYDDGGFVIESGNDLISAKKIYTSREQAEKTKTKTMTIYRFNGRANNEISLNQHKTEMVRKNLPQNRRAERNTRLLEARGSTQIRAERSAV